MRRDKELFDHAASDEMLLDNPFEHRRIAAAVPRAFGIDDRNRAALANAKAVDLRTEDAALLRQAKLLQAAFQKFPRRQAAILVAALRVRLIAAQEDVPARYGNADADGG